MLQRLWASIKKHPTRTIRVTAVLLIMGGFAHQFASNVTFSVIDSRIPGPYAKKSVARKEMAPFITAANAFSGTCITVGVILMVWGIWRRRRGLN